MTMSLGHYQGMKQLKIVSVLLLALLASMPQRMFGAERLRAPDVTVGQNLAAPSSIMLGEDAPKGLLQITLTSEQPDQFMLSKNLSAAGSSSIVLEVPESSKRTPEFYVYGLGHSGTFDYVMSAPGYEPCKGRVTLGPSGVVIKGSFGLGTPMMTTTGAPASNMSLYSALLGSSGEYIETQPVAGGRSLNVSVSSSQPEVGAVKPATAVIAGGSSGTTVKFQPASAGKTTIVASSLNSREPSSRFAMIPVTVIMPGLSVTDQVAIGRDLQIGGTLSLGQTAPAGGVEVTLTSNNPRELLLSRTANETGSASITLNIPAGGSTGLYRVQSLSEKGTATYTASAPGFVSRTATVYLTPSGVVIGFQPPDEAELFRKEAAEEKHGLTLSLSNSRSFPLTAYMVQLHPENHRGADITVQALRAGVSANIELKNSDPAVGAIVSRVQIQAGSPSAFAEFTALREGTTVLSVAAPAGFTEAKNATSLIVIVRP